MKYRLLISYYFRPIVLLHTPPTMTAESCNNGEDWIIDWQPLKVFEMPERDEGEWNDLPLYKNEVDGGDSEVVYDKQ